jgi:hypothetical protein
MAAEVEAEVEKGHCPACGPNRYADIVAKHEQRDDDEESGVWFHATHAVLKCRGCGSVYCKKTTLFSEDMDHRENPYTGEWEPYLPSTETFWPSPVRREQPTWIGKIAAANSGLADLLSDVYGALDADLRVPAAIALRTVFDSSTELLGIDAAKGFAEKLNDLQSLGKISSDEKTILETLTDAGSAAAHRGWRPSLSELDTMASIIESYLYRTFVLGDEAATLRRGIPPRPRRRSGRPGTGTPPPSS